ncbi:hypothetical protein [Thalassobellus sediminis]|uniref:hypothetical protein n=1 Tax=Thalassobellus sediminis TaxID=3367753 RepID=UPI00379F014D
MKRFKNILFLLFVVFTMISFSNCAGTQKLDKSLPIDLGDVYYQSWVAGVKGGGSGFNIFIPMESNPNNIMLDSVFFKGKEAKLEYRNNSIFIGRFKTSVNQKEDIIMSSDRFAEYGNKVPNLPKKSPFQLKEDECVVSYKLNNKTHYFKIDKIIKKETQNFMSAPPRKQ